MSNYANLDRVDVCRSSNDTHSEICELTLALQTLEQLYYTYIK